MKTKDQKSFLRYARSYFIRAAYLDGLWDLPDDAWMRRLTAWRKLELGL